MNGYARFGWVDIVRFLQQTALFPAGYSEGSQIEVGQYRTNEEHIISGMFEREKIHHIAPSSERVEEEMQKFLNWFDAD